MGVALSHDLLRVSLCCSWLLCCKANFLFAIISKCHFYCRIADAKRYESIKCAWEACVIILRELSRCRSSINRLSVRITANHAGFCAKECHEESSSTRDKMLLFPVIFIWDVYRTHIDAISTQYIWYYSDTFEINSIISTHLPTSRLFCYICDLYTIRMYMSWFFGSVSGTPWEDIWRNFDFYGVPMRRASNSHIFAISCQMHLYMFCNHPTGVFFHKKRFFGKLRNLIMEFGSIS